MIDYREIAVTVERLSPDSKLFKLCIIQPKHILCFKSNFSQCFWRILMRRHMEVLCQKYFYCTKMKNAESQGSSLHFLIMKNTACLKPGPKPFSPNCGFCFCFCSYLRAFRAPTVHSSLPSKLHKNLLVLALSSIASVTPPNNISFPANFKQVFRVVCSLCVTPHLSSFTPLSPCCGIHPSGLHFYVGILQAFTRCSSLFSLCTLSLRDLIYLVWFQWSSLCRWQSDLHLHLSLSSWL